MSTTQQQSLHFNSKGQGESIQTRLALLSHLNEKQEGSSIYKKKTFFWDQEHLYSENLMLKAQVKQLTQANTKSRTTILEMQAEMKQKQSKNNEHDLKESALRSMSLRNLSKNSMIAFRPLMQDEGKSKSIRRIVRELKEEISALKNENQIMKRSIKYTRMSELQTLNKEMDIQLQRLNRLVNENKNKYYGLALEMEALNEVLKKEKLAKQLVGQERDKLRKELTKIKNDYKEYEKKIQLSQKQSRNEIRKLRSINPEIAVLNTESAAKTLGKLNSQSFKSIPKLEYSISGLQRMQNDTINFDKLLNSESELKSIPKITSFTSLELQKMSFKNDGNSPEHRAKTNEKIQSCSEMENLQEEAYEFEEDEVEIQEVNKSKDKEPKVEQLKTIEIFEEEVPKAKQQAQKPKAQQKQEEWEEELEQIQEQDDNDKKIVKPAKNEKTEELFQDFEVEDFEPAQSSNKQEPVKKEIPQNPKQKSKESFEEDAQIIKEIERPLPEENNTESKTESKQHQPVVLTTKSLQQEEEKQQTAQPSQSINSQTPKIDELHKPLQAIEAKKEEIIKQEDKIQIEKQVKVEKKEEVKVEMEKEVINQVKEEVDVQEQVQEEVKEESVYQDLMVQEEI